MAGLLLASSLVASCFIPMSYWAAKSRQNVTPGTREELQPGVMNIEDVLLELGEPDVVSDDGRHLGYEWTRVKGLLLVGAMYAGSVGEVTRTSRLELAFDEQGRLASVDIVSKRLHIE